MEQSSVKQLPGTLIRVDTIDGKVTTSYSRPLEFRETLQRKWVRTPNYWERLRAGERMPVNPFKYFREVVKIPTGRWQYLWIPNGNRNDYFGPWPDGYGTRKYLSTPISVIQNMNAEAEARILSKIKEEKVNLGNLVAESNQTIKSIGTVARCIAGCIRNLRGGNFIRAAEALGLPLGSARVRKAKGRYNRTYPKDPTAAAANGWLALHFGWAPLISDIYGSCEAIANWQYERKAPISTKRVKVTRATSARESPPGDFTTLYETLTTVKYTVSYRISKETFQRLQTVGLTNPLSIAWEITPWSFVVDWFLPIGRWLGNLDATVGIDFVDACWTRVDEQSITMRIDTSKVSGNTRYTYALSGETKALTIGRSPSVPPSVLTFPRFKNPFNLIHAVTGLSLLRQVIS